MTGLAGVGKPTIVAVSATVDACETFVQGTAGREALGHLGLHWPTESCRIELFAVSPRTLTQWAHRRLVWAVDAAPDVDRIADGK